VLNLPAVPREFRGWVLAYIELMTLIRPAWELVEVPLYHPTLRFGGTPDRVGVWTGVRTVLEIKSGAARESDAIQTALQAILVAHTSPLPAMSWQRLVGYIKPGGRFVVERMKDARDYDEAHRILKEFCR